MGELLQLSESKMDELVYLYTRDPRYGMRQVVMEWVNWNCDRSRYGNPTKRWFLNAVKEIDPELAKSLEEKYREEIEERKHVVIKPAGSLYYGDDY